MPVIDVLTLLGDVVDDVLGMVTDALQLADDVAQHNDAVVCQGVPVVLVSVMTLGQLHRGHQSLREGHSVNIIQSCKGLCQCHVLDKAMIFILDINCKLHA